MTALAPTRNVTERETDGGARGRGFDVVRIALARDNSPVAMAMVELEPTRAERSVAQMALRSAAERSAAERSDAGRSGHSAARPWADGFLPDAKEWFVTTPAVVLLKDGQVLAGWEAAAPKMEQLMKMLGAGQTGTNENATRAH